MRSRSTHATFAEREQAVGASSIKDERTTRLRLRDELEASKMKDSMEYSQNELRLGYLNDVIDDRARVRARYLAANRFQAEADSYFGELFGTAATGRPGDILKRDSWNMSYSSCNLSTFVERTLIS